MYVLRRNFDGRKTDVVSTYFFDVISITEKSTSFRRTWFDAVSKGEKSTLFQRTLFDAISMSKKSTSFQCTFFDLISMDGKLAFFRCIFWCNFDGKLMQIRGADFHVFLKDKKSLSFFISF